MKAVRFSLLTSAATMALFSIHSSSALPRDLQEQRLAARLNAESSVGRYLVTFVEPGLAEYQGGGITGLARTAPLRDLVSSHSSRKFDASSAAAKAYRTYLVTQRSLHIRAIEQRLGRSLAIRYTYDVTRNAVSAEMSASEAALVNKVAGVATVSPVTIQQPVTFRGPTFVGANTIWDGSGVPSYDTATRGRGVKVGVLDTGSYAAHPSFANDPVCGFSNSSPKLFAKDCIDSSDCTGPSPEAESGNGHGVHTASTAAGNTIDNTITPAPLLPDGITMSGVAPCAEVHTYKVCDAGGCYGDSIAAGIQTAITDQIDALNYSIGTVCGGGDPWADSIQLDFLSAESADIFVAAAAGNISTNCSDPTGLVTNNGPWLTTVAASSQDEVLSPELSATGPGTPPDLTQDIPLTPGSSTLPPAQTANLSNTPLRLDEANLLGCTDSGGFEANYFTGAIAIIERGTCAFSEKITNAYDAGERTVVIANNTSGSITMDTSTLPAAIADDIAAFSADQNYGDALIAFVEANGNATGNYFQSAIRSIQGDVLASFSFRGPTQEPYQDLTKPDITGPGVNIYAALDAGSGNYGLESGTSMSSPHLTGAGALVRAVQPDWTPMEIKSAIQTTATLTGFEEDGATMWTPDDVGSGRVDLSKATRAGLTLDETEANFLAASPDQVERVTSDSIFNDGFDPSASSPISQLNLASMRNVACDTQCTWTRTFKNRLTTNGTWTVSSIDPAYYTLSFSPAAFSLAPGDSQTVRITATRIGVPPNAALQYGRVDIIEGNGLSPEQHLTLAVSTEASTVSCANGNCAFQVDGLNGSVNGYGCSAGWNTDCQQLWLNRFTPDADDYPITLTSISTIFMNLDGWNAPGDQVSIYVYQDDDSDPSNGAAPKSAQSYLMSFVASAFVQIPLDPPIILDGPGDVLIGMANPYSTNVGGAPSTADAGPFRGRSWFGVAVADANGTAAPDLSSPEIGLRRNDDATLAFPYNWLIRAQGTNASGRSITLEPIEQ